MPFRSGRAPVPAHGHCSSLGGVRAQGTVVGICFLCPHSRGVAMLRHSAVYGIWCKNNSFLNPVPRISPC